MKSHFISRILFQKKENAHVRFFEANHPKTGEMYEIDCAYFKVTKLQYILFYMYFYVYKYSGFISAIFAIALFNVFSFNINVVALIVLAFFAATVVCLFDSLFLNVFIFVSDKNKI